MIALMLIHKNTTFIPAVLLNFISEGAGTWLTLRLIFKTSVSRIFVLGLEQPTQEGESCKPDNPSKVVEDVESKRPCVPSNVNHYHEAMKKVLAVKFAFEEFAEKISVLLATSLFFYGTSFMCSILFLCIFLIFFFFSKLTSLIWLYSIGRFQ